MDNNKYRFNIELDKDCYNINQTVNGLVKINQKEVFCGNEIHLNIFGHELITFNNPSINDFEMAKSAPEFNPKPKTKKTLSESNAEHIMYNHNYLLHKFTEKEYMYGHYEVPFNFQIGPNLPSSCKYDWWDENYRENSLRIKYKLTVTIKSRFPDSKDLKYSKKFLINNDDEDVLYRLVNINSKDKNASSKNYNLNFCGCMSKGTLNQKLRTKDNKPMLFIGEPAGLIIEIDNKNGKANVKGMKISLKKRLNLNAYDKKKNNFIHHKLERVIESFDQNAFELNDMTINDDFLVKAGRYKQLHVNIPLFTQDMEDVTSFGKFLENRFFIDVELNFGVEVGIKPKVQSEILIMNKAKEITKFRNTRFLDDKEVWSPTRGDVYTAILSQGFDSILDNQVFGQDKKYNKNDNINTLTDTDVGVCMNRSDDNLYSSLNKK